MQTAVSVERQITQEREHRDFVPEFASGVHQFLTRNINAPFPNTYNPNDPTSGIRPFGDAAETSTSTSRTEIRAEPVDRECQCADGLEVSLFGWYTLNNVNANTNGASSFPNNQYDLAENYGPTAYDVRNRLFVGGTIALPRGFRLNPFMVASSGIPFNITLGQDYNGDSIFNDRPTFAKPG